MSIGVIHPTKSSKRTIGVYDCCEATENELTRVLLQWNKL